MVAHTDMSENKNLAIPDAGKAERPVHEAEKDKRAAKRFAALEALMQAATENGTAKTRPVDSWNPPYCGEVLFTIKRDGSWHYRGSPMARMPLVKLFASILRKDSDGKTYLVTPAEKVGVDVEDAPFLAVEMAVDGKGERQSLTFRTNVDDVVTVDSSNPLRFEKEKGGGLKPYVFVRGRLEALVTRSVYAELADLAVPNSAGKALGVWSGGIWWRMG